MGWWQFLMALFGRKSKDDALPRDAQPGELGWAEEAQRPSETTETKPVKKGGFVVLVGAAAAAVATPLVQKWEGKENDPYQDIVNVWTVCYGDTSDVGPNTPTQTDAQCDARLDKQLEKHAAPVLQCTPILKDHPWQLGASISLAYNIGTGAYCKSSLAKDFNAGKFVSACDGFSAWRKAGGQVVQGLVNRRAEERLVCLTEIPRGFAK